MAKRAVGKDNYKKTKYPGVRVREHKEKRYLGKPDKYFLIRYGSNGRMISEGVGFASDDMDAKLASEIRTDILSNIRLGTGYQSLKEKRALRGEQTERDNDAKLAEELENLPFSVLGDKYIEWAKEEKPASYKGDESRYRQHLKPYLGDIPVKDIITFTLENFKKELKKKKTRSNKPLSPKTVQHCLTLVRQMYNHAPSWGIFMGSNPVSEINKNKSKKKKFLSIPDNKRDRIFSRDEAAQLLGYFKDGLQDKKGRVSGRNMQLHDITILGIYAGLRAGEIFSLTWRDIELDAGLINIKNPKNEEDRAAYINPPIREMLLRRKEEMDNKNSLLFQSRDGEKIKEVSNAFDRAIEKLKFNDGVTKTKDRIVFHTTRHTFASWLAMDGTPLGSIQKLMGHKDISMTIRYAKYSPDYQREAVNRMAEEKPKAENRAVNNKK